MLWTLSSWDKTAYWGKYQQRLFFPDLKEVIFHILEAESKHVENCTAEAASLTAQATQLYRGGRNTLAAYWIAAIAHVLINEKTLYRHARRLRQPQQ